jgi:hypothetical protein
MSNLQHFRADDVRGHQVGGELHALVVEPQNHAQGLGQAGLGHARQTDQQGMAPGQQGDQHLVDDRLLTVNDLANGGPGLLDSAHQSFYVLEVHHR